MIEASRKVATDFYMVLAESLRARDAEAIIRKADAKIVSIGDLLINADRSQTPDDDTWADCYKEWKQNVEQVDRLLVQWNEHHKPYLDVRGRDFEGGAPPPPPHIVTKGPSAND